MPLSENAQVFPPSEEFAAQANATAELYDEAQRRGDEFWAEQARTLLHWDTEFTETLDWSTPPFAKWFQDGRLNAAYNAVDRHVEAGHGDRVALYFEGEPGDTEEYTYARLKDEVCRAANAFAELGVGHGDRVAVYLPMIPQAVITMLACARLGAIHSVIFGGFSADAIHSRVNDGEAKLVVTADGSYRRGKPTRLKPTVDAALAKGAPSVEHVLVVRRNGEEIEWTEQRDVWWHDVVDRASAEHTPQPHGAEDPLFILYTSGTTGKPKGILHTTGGYLTQAAYTHRMVFDIKPETDVYWCTADVGWVTGHTYIVYGPLLNGTSQVIYEGTPDSPHRGRFWEIVDKYGVSILYTSPTAIRTMMKWGEQIPGEYSLESLRLLGTVGEAINPEAWTWFHRVIGHGRCPIVDTWWQTETGAIMISQLPGVTAAKPGSAQRALPGISAEVVDDFGQPLGAGESGLLALTHPWPSMLRTLWGDDQRFQDTYWSRFGERTYFAGDGARRDEDGDIWVLGRVDDVMNVSGHRLSTPEIESALVSHPAVAESAVVGAADETTGQAVIAFVILSDAAAEQDGDREELAAQIRAHVGEAISPIAKPKKVLIVPELPKTRSGKIMRRLLKDVAEDRPVGDTSTLADSTVMDQITRSLRS
ncbi:acetyl-CoA synthetase [Rothia kristinae]|nr:acetyl-CoA synthetase [Rothia kristinae]KTR67171.1 acetyl-CoA synthetase [Rothia kristinae]KTR67532.1 acetyl-CoA synthetase [Rothia kristinae]KTR75918.1 acetyl-CoA synthetase [Rothia kristinae]KTR76279.1 acetyl-CoA synthetase [Rothia kristinae]